MATSKTSGSDYAIRFNVSSKGDSSDDGACNDEDECEESASNKFTDPLRSSLFKKKDLNDDLSKRARKKVDVVRLDIGMDKKHINEQNIKQEVLSVGSNAEVIKEKPMRTKVLLIKPLTAIRKKHSSSLVDQPQSAPSSELSSPTTLSKRHHIPSSSTLSSNSSCKDMSNYDVDKDSKVSLTSTSDVTLDSNINSCNNKEDVFSIFSGLKDKLGRFSAESREMLDRKVFKTTNVDVPKIASVLVGNPVEGELLAEEAKEDTQFDASLSSKEDKVVVESIKQSSFDSSSSLEPLETEMKEITPRTSAEEVQTSGFDIGRLMKLVHSDSSKRLSRNSSDEDKKTEESDSTRGGDDEGWTSVDTSMTPSDILTHEAAVDAFRSSTSNLLDSGTKRLTEAPSGHSKLVKKSSASGTLKSANPFMTEKKETISKSSSISMTLSSLLSRQKSSSKLSSGSSPEATVMTPKTSEMKLESVSDVAIPSVDFVRSEMIGDASGVSEDPAMGDECLVLQSSKWRIMKYLEVFKRRVSLMFFYISLFLAWLFVPLPPYVAGMVAGILGTLLSIQAVNIFQMFSGSKSSHEAELSNFEWEPLVDGDTGDLDVRESKNVDGSFKGWLNELGSGNASLGKVIYDPRDYHINATHSIYVTLEGTNLRLQTPRLSMPKRALWSDDSPTSVTFVRQRHYDLLGSNVLLLPHNLISKRLWSKKYPICIEIIKTTPTNGAKLRLRQNAAKFTASTLKGSETQKVEDASSPKTSKAPQTADSSSVTPSQSTDQVKKVLYLFARTSREKEEWFRRFEAAALGRPWPTRFSDIVRSSSTSQAFKRKTHRRTASQPNKKSIADEEVLTATDGHSTTRDGPGMDALDPSADQYCLLGHGSLTPEQNLSYYAQYMSRSVNRKGNAGSDQEESLKAHGTSVERQNKRSSSVGGNPAREEKRNVKEQQQQMRSDGGIKNGRKDEDGSGTSGEKDVQFEDCDQQLLWLNTLVSRCFMDFLREKYWAEKIREKIQKKLSKIHIPYIMDQLSVTGIDLGSSVPSICSASLPYLDDRGFWVDLKVSYAGGFCITMETKCNLMKLKQNPTSKGSAEGGAEGGSDASSPLNVQEVEKRMAALDSEEEDSAESSTDEESRMFEEDPDDSTEDKKMTTQPIGKRLLRLVDKISQSRYFQQATDYKYIRRAIEEVSNTRLELNVEVKSLEGILAINIPPPPTDRIWYGFRGNPQFDLTARPRVGVREVSLSPVTEWIEKKLAIEFQRVFVMPNMDDVKIPLMLDHLTS